MKNIVFMIILSTACILVACNSNDLTVQSLTLVNEHGERRMRLYADQDTARIDLYNKQGHIILSINTRDDMPSMILTNGQPRGSIVLTATPKSQMLTFGHGGESRLNIANFATHAQIEVGPTAKGRSIYLSALDTGTAGILLHDGTRQRGGMYLDLANQSSIRLFSSTGRTLWQVP